MTKSIDDILAVASDPAHAREATAKILLREDLRAVHAELERDLLAELDKFKDDITKPEHVQELAAEVQALEAEMADSEVEFRFRAVSYVEWMRLIAAHPPTPQQLRDNKQLDHNPDTFQPAALAASCVDPPMTVEQAVEMRDVLHFDQYTVLWGTCAMVNRGGDARPKSKLAGLVLRRNGESGTTAANTESHDPSSLDGS